MKQYNIDGLKEREKYERFIEYILPLSDAFSVVYFQYRDSEKLSASARRVKDGLKKYKIYSKTTDSMPSMITKDHRHKYVYTLYRSDPGAKDILLSVENLYEWDYSKYPMDLCFFKDGRAFFVSSAHERYADITIEDPGMKDALERLGIGLTFEKNVAEDDLYFDEKAVSGICPNDAEEDAPASFESDDLLAATEKYNVFVDEKELYVIGKSNGTRIILAKSGEGSLTDRVLYKCGAIYAALTAGEFDEFCTDKGSEVSDGVWRIDADRAEFKKVCAGQYDMIIDDDDNIYVGYGGHMYKINCKTGEVTESFFD